MRRIVRSLAVLGVLALGACGGGGSVLSFDNNSQADRTLVTVVGPSNIARVLPGSSLAISATQVRGSQNGVVNGNRFIWSAQLVPSGQYTANTLGQTKACGSIQYTPAGGSASALTADMNLYVTIDPVNEANIIFTPPAVFPVPTGSPVGSSATPTYPYCVVVSATPLNGGQPQPAEAGSITVAVVNPLSPEQ
ncbi:MAG TPA: hypothetical protein VHS78_00610 [Candidatus Elarobacter sp.]|jgi:hypothetical protein|nr:hypothetical protein [Candidatus Elarobacter sp.]